MGFTNNVDVWDPQFKKGALMSELFSGADDGDTDFSNFNLIATSAAGRSGAGFHAVADIGSLGGTATAQLAAWLPGYDSNFAVFA
ncbi:MAG: hypothetical protein H7267_05965 [Sandarakinorhabdus sp.]|nr:hypothetical protein [Sandarakinorhabdus sp.]